MSALALTALAGGTKAKIHITWLLPVASIFGPDLLGRLVMEAQERGMHPENYIIGFLEWKTGRELSHIRLFNRMDKQIYIVKKRLLAEEI